METQLLLSITIMIAAPALIWALYWLYFRTAGKALISALFAFGLGLGVRRLYEEYLLQGYSGFATGVRPYNWWGQRWIGQAGSIPYQFALFGSFLTVIFAMPLVLLVYERWLLPPSPDDREARIDSIFMNQEQGPAGDKRWICFWIVGMILSLWLAAGLPTRELLEIPAHVNLSPWAWVLIVLVSFAAWPLCRMLRRDMQPAVPADDLKDERDRVLRLLEDKRITVEECAELLSALGESRRPLPVLPAGASTPATRKLLIAGVVLVLVGFLLPWFYINAKQFGDIAERQPSIMEFWGHGRTIFPANEQIPFHMFMLLNGADIARGYGWVILLAGLIAAVLPFISFRVPASGRRWLLLLPLLVGSVMLLYLLVQNINFVSYGLVLVIVGYGLEYAGVVRERRV